MRILDLFSGAGGAAMGYHRAFPDAEIVGVDINPQPRYPFTFVQADAMTYPLDGFDFIHASPPCQAYTTMSNRWRGKGGAADEHVELIAATRERLQAAGAPYVIENVDGARRHMQSAVRLTGGYFGLKVHRPRLFECSFPVVAPPVVRVVEPLGVYGALDGRRLTPYRPDGSFQRAARTLNEAMLAMGIPWMTWDELRESIPPAYTEYIGRQYAMCGYRRSGCGMTVCCIDDCDRPAKTRGMCALHYKRVLRGAEVSAPITQGGTIRHPRLSFDQLEAAARCSSMLGLARALGRPPRALYGWRGDGIPLYMADRLAVKLGLHPAEIWADWYEVAA